MQRNTHTKRPTLHMPHSRPVLPYSVEDAWFATEALALAYARFRAEEAGKAVTVFKYGIAVEYVP